MKLGRYEIVRELGKGAMGIVYLAKDPLIGRLTGKLSIQLTRRIERASALLSYADYSMAAALILSLRSVMAPRCCRPG